MTAPVTYEQAYLFAVHLRQRAAINKQRPETGQLGPLFCCAYRLSVKHKGVASANLQRCG